MSNPNPQVELEQYIEEYKEQLIKRVKEKEFFIWDYFETCNDSVCELKPDKLKEDIINLIKQ